MSDSERTPLINGGNGNRTRELLHDPPWLDSYKFFVFGSWFNVLLFFIPLSFLSHFLNWDAALRFSFSFFAIIPLAKVRWLCSFSSRARSAYSPRSRSQLLGDATDQLSVRLGQTLSGLLNASFGNAVEIIVGVAALLQGELRIVQTSVSVGRLRRIGVRNLIAHLDVGINPLEPLTSARLLISRRWATSRVLR